MNMDRVILQVPMPKSLKQAAEAVSSDYGFSSLQEAIRILLKKLAIRELSFAVTQEKTESIKLTPAAKHRYHKMMKDFKDNKNVLYAKDFADFTKQLNS